MMAAALDCTSPRCLFAAAIVSAALILNNAWNTEAFSLPGQFLTREKLRCLSSHSFGIRSEVRSLDHSRVRPWFTLSPYPGTGGANLGNVGRASCRRCRTSVNMIVQNQDNYSTSYSAMQRRRDVKLPLLVLTDENDPGQIRKVVFPMPSSHLPDEISTLNLYGTELTSPAHIRMIAEAQKSEGQSYGHVIWKPPASEEDDSTGLVGAIGCASQILSTNPSESATGEEEASQRGEDDDDEGSQYDSAVTVLVRGSFRFIVKKIESTFPYPVAIVDELLDDQEVSLEKTEVGGSARTKAGNDEEEEEDEEDEDIYENMDPSELTNRCVDAMRVLTRMKLEETEKTPLETEILSSFNMPTLSRASAEEMAAVLEVFMGELVEMNDRTLRRFAVGMMAAEIGDLDFEQRRDAMITTDGIDRLRKVLSVLESKISLARAKSMAQELSDTSNEDQRLLKVGEPSLPPWAKQIKPGMRLEYYWNEEWEWCAGTVKDTMMVVDELIVTLEFEDGETHRIPFNPNEKARWRPAES